MELLFVIVLILGLENAPAPMPNIFVDAHEYTTDEMYISCNAAYGLGKAVGLSTYWDKVPPLDTTDVSKDALYEAAYALVVAENVLTKAIESKAKWKIKLRYTMYHSKLKRQYKRYCI